MLVAGYGYRAPVASIQQRTLTFGKFNLFNDGANPKGKEEIFTKITTMTRKPLSLTNIYQQNIQRYQKAVKKLSNALRELSWSRLVVFVFSAFLIVLLANNGMTVIVWLVALAGGLGFAFLMRRHNRVTYQKQHTTFLIEINEQEILKRQNKLSNFPDGRAFIRRDHPYVADLDVFGSHSLYQLINRTTTESGSACLAEWLSKPAAKEVIVDRQQAVQELTPKLAWRQEFQASGRHFTNSQSDFRKLLAWLDEPVQLLPYATKYLAVSIILALLTTLSLLYHFRFAYASELHSQHASAHRYVDCQFVVSEKDKTRGRRHYRQHP